MNDNTLNERLAQHYKSKKLPPGTLAKLTRMIDMNAAAEVKPKRPRGVRISAFTGIFSLRPFSMALAALSCILITGYVVWSVAVHYAPFPAALPLAVAKEIALNHRKNLTPEYTEARVSALPEVMTKLDFTPIAPNLIGKLKLAFHGARYCSIQGQLAVQMKFQDGSGTLYTLYQAIPTEPLSGLNDEVIEFEGLRVKIWQERGLLMGLACPAGLEAF